MAGYWPSSFLCVSSRSIKKNSQKEERGQYPAILSEQAWSRKDLLYYMALREIFLAVLIHWVVQSGQARQLHLSLGVFYCSNDYIVNRFLRAADVIQRDVIRLDFCCLTGELARVNWTFGNRTQSVDWVWLSSKYSQIWINWLWLRRFMTEKHS